MRIPARAVVLTLALALAFTLVPGSAAHAGSYGHGFDTCEAPSVATMQAWRASPYRVVGIYVGGINRACANTGLTAGWVREVRRLGWRLVPTYVGRQAPCGPRTDLVRIRPGAAVEQGRRAADDAARDLRRLGLPRRSPVFLDIEAYDTSAPGCSAAVLEYVRGWTARLERLGHRSGVYANAANGLGDLVRQYPSGTPDFVWFAHWNGVAGTGSPYLPGRMWRGKRIHQYLGDHLETWGGVTLNIDSNRIGRDVARALP